MATLTIRQLDDDVYERLKLRARANKRSLEAEARALLEDRSRDIDEIVDDLEVFHEQMVARHGYLPDSTETLKKLREDM